MAASSQQGSDDSAAKAERRKLASLGKDAARELRRKAVKAKRDDRAARRAAGQPGRRLRRWVLVGVLSLLGFLFVLPPFLIPVDGRITSRFFIRNAPDSPRLFDFERHVGLDFAAATGTPVIASRSGRVVATVNDPRYGNYVDIRHPLGWITRYAHLSRIDVNRGDFVLRRRRIGTVGSTGRTTGAHLHFELRINGRAYPPGWVLVIHRIRWGIWRAVSGSR